MGNVSLRTTKLSDVVALYNDEIIDYTDDCICNRPVYISNLLLGDGI